VQRQGSKERKKLYEILQFDYPKSEGNKNLCLFSSEREHGKYGKIRKNFVCINLFQEVAKGERFRKIYKIKLFLFISLVF
jgi:hypothetical protein